MSECSSHNCNGDKYANNTTIYHIQLHDQHDIWLLLTTVISYSA